MDSKKVINRKNFDPAPGSDLRVCTNGTYDSFFIKIF